MNNLIHTIQLWDERTILRIVDRRVSSLTTLMRAVSTMGDGYVWALLTILLYVSTDVSPSWLLMGLTAFSVELSVYKLIKQTTTRQRPFKVNPSIENLVVPQDEFSFPSGHTAAATVAALLFSMALPALTPLFILLTVLIGLSRIYLGVHYPSDVLMGFLLGLFSFLSANFVL